MSGAEPGLALHPALPALIGFLLTLVMSTGGVTGAFVLLPIQVSVLGYTAPGVTPTNHLFNLVCIPSGVYRYVREGRMVWPLAVLIVAGTAPGVVAGSLARIHWLQDPRGFKLFMGCVLLLIGTRLLHRAFSGTGAPGTAPEPGSPSPSETVERPSFSTQAPEKLQRSPRSKIENLRFSTDSSGRGGQGERSGRSTVRTLRFDALRLEYQFQGQIHGLSVPPLLAVSLLVGAVGGAYGIGGGAILAPVLIAMYRLPVHTTAGATLLGTWVTSAVGVVFFALLAAQSSDTSLMPDWSLGLLFGAGGVPGMYVGAALQRRLPARLIETALGVAVTALAVGYVLNYFL